MRRSRRSWRSPRVSATSAGARPSPIRARCSSRSRCSAATTATTARSRSRPPSSTRRILTPDEVVSIAAAGARAGCKEALFTLGDRPEERYPEARAWLDARGHASTLDYVRAVAIRVIEDTGLLPHLNPGVMSYEELARLKHVSASMGIMLETSSDRLSAKGGPHFGSPDKVPAVRLRTIEDAGRLAIPFTTGILVGIGETPRERAASLLAIRDLHLRYHHIQEVIVQNFRAKPGTAMHRAPEPTDDRVPRGGRGRPARARSARERAGAPEPLGRGAAAPPARRRDQRLGRRLAAHARPRQPRAPLAADRGARRDDRRSRQTPARTPRDLPALRRAAGSRGSRARCGRRSPRSSAPRASRSRASVPNRSPGRTRISPISRGRSR